MVASTAYQRLLEALHSHGRQVRANGNGRAMAQCPAHDDNNPSLRITAIDGRTLMYCHAGCETPDVLAAISLTMADLFDDSGGVTYEYSDRRRVHRTPDKQFRQSGNTKGTALYQPERQRLDPSILAGASAVFWPEGEQDCDAISSLGGVAVCSAMGAGKAHLADHSPLKGKHVVVVADQDKAGYAHADQVAEQVAPIALSVQIVQAAEGKDAADHIAAGYPLDAFVLIRQVIVTGEDETVPTMEWPTLDPAAFHGVAGQIVQAVAPHTEADPVAMLAQLLCRVGVEIGNNPHIRVANKRHAAIINPLVVGRTNSGAKGTGYDVVDAIMRKALLDCASRVVSGLSTAEGLIELVRDPSGDDPDANDFEPGVADKRRLVKETEFRSVLTRMRREGNTLGETMRQCFDGDDLRTLTRKHNSLTATRPHIAFIGHITPREFLTTLRDNDLSGGSVNRHLLILSKRSRLHSRFGNVPDEVLASAADTLRTAVTTARQRFELEFSESFWPRWDVVYAELNRERPESKASDATARGVIYVLRLSMIYALLDGAEQIGVEHLNAALALWRYAEHSARWLFSSFEAERDDNAASGLAEFIRAGGTSGRTRTQISRDYFNGNVKAGEINAALAPLIHDGIVFQVREERASGRAATRYLHRTARNNEGTKHAAQSHISNSYVTNARSESSGAAAGNSSQFVDSSSAEMSSDLQNSSDSLFRNAECFSGRGAGRNGHQPNDLRGVRK